MKTQPFWIATGFRIRFSVFASISMLLLLSPPAMADGLVMQLPKNGTKATFSAKGSSTTTMRLAGHIKPETLVGAAKDALEPQKADFRQEFSVALVGAETISGIRCRWLQLHRGESAQLEILVPEELCASGRDTLGGSVRTFFNWKDADRAAGKIVAPPGFDRIRYELERMRPLFPAPLKNLEALPSETVKTPVGVFADCRVITGTDAFEGALLDNCYWKVRSTFKIWMHDDAPFGVVKLSFDSESTEFTENCSVDSKLKSEMQLTRVDQDAARLLPEKRKGEKAKSAP
jgi:hypothetical protein